MFRTDQQREKQYLDDDTHIQKELVLFSKQAFASDAQLEAQAKTSHVGSENEVLRSQNMVTAPSSPFSSHSHDVYPQHSFC